MADALVRRDAVDALRQGYERLQKGDLAVVKAMNRFAELPLTGEGAIGPEALLAMGDVELAERGWTRKDLRMAIYGTLPRSRWPAAMQAAHERVGMRLRKQDRTPAKMQFNLNMVNIPPPRPVLDAEVVILPDEETPE
jgi:hypothetical protein